MIHILVVDDDEKLTQTVCTYLNSSGYEAKGVLSVASAGWEISTIALLVFAVFLPLFGAISGAVLIGYGIWRKAHHKYARQTFAATVTCFIIAIFPYIAAFVLVMLGGFPVPN